MYGKKGGNWLAFCVCYLFRNLRAIPTRARMGKTVANTTPVAAGHVDVFTLTKISIPMLRAIPIIAKIGTTVPKMVINEAPHPVVFAPTISVIAIGTRIATSNMLTATPTTAFAVAIFVHGLSFVM